MDIERLPIISELYGEKNSGSAEFCFYIAKSTNSLWIESCKRTCTKRAELMHIDLNSMHICKVLNIYLLVNKLQTKEIHNFIETHKIKLLIINKLDDLTTADHQEDTKSCLELVKHLKMMYITHSVKSIVITNVRPGYSNSSLAKRLLGGMFANSAFSAYCAIEDEETESSKYNLNTYIATQRFSKKDTPRSTVHNNSWDSCMPTAFYIEKTPIPGVHMMRMVRPKTPNGLQYVLKVNSDEISVDRI
ncbi:hypothetical protein NEAUS04_2211 [Nematocida ausubeli]|uniref:Uncharacterized protein n=1 Tax=Nematocida ausubeli (strain ATCC PRA-371 / ERTm2) TaxID=1913371 RepID=A0A086IZS2_NEMA1|nr:uncharacterized protein NESG_02164 [Nematocida ausubeli]KAI5164444.1 hypothetical protein NEAUS04_2211 [Nematocida ausubeli]KFG25390.1 hypothetical protein NESG_02164 [Nematocida ausubeli]